jgi:hypothetical protein
MTADRFTEPGRSGRIGGAVKAVLSGGNDAQIARLRCLQKELTAIAGAIGEAAAAAAAPTTETGDQNARQA